MILARLSDKIVRIVLKGVMRAGQIKSRTGGIGMRRTAAALKRRDYIVKAIALLVISAVTAVFIILAANGKLFGSEADEVFDTFYAVGSAPAQE